MNFESMTFRCHEAKELKDIEGIEILDVPDSLPKNFRLPFVKYHLYMYDKESPLVVRYRDLKKRQDVALKHSGILDSTFNQDKIDEIRALKHEGQAQLIASILKAQNNVVWDALVVNETLHHKITFDILKDQAAQTQDLAKQVKLLSEQEELVSRIQGFYNSLFGSVHEQEREDIKMRIRPETAWKFRK